jgi:hypothetical protein
MRKKNNEKRKSMLIHTILKDTKNIVKHCDSYKIYMDNTKYNQVLKLPTITTLKKTISTNKSEYTKIDEEFSKTQDFNNNEENEKYLLNKS